MLYLTKVTCLKMLSQKKLDLQKQEFKQIKIGVNSWLTCLLSIFTLSRVCADPPLTGGMLWK